MTAIQSSSLVKVYHKSKTPALKQISLTVNRGQIFTLLGRNGAGKTTFLRIAATQLLPSNGKVEVLGGVRSEEHTSELQSRSDLVCRLLLEKKRAQHQFHRAHDTSQL